MRASCLSEVSPTTLRHATASLRFTSSNCASRRIRRANTNIQNCIRRNTNIQTRITIICRDYNHAVRNRNGVDQARPPDVTGAMSEAKRTGIWDFSGIWNAPPIRDEAKHQIVKLAPKEFPVDQARQRFE